MTIRTKLFYAWIGVCLGVGIVAGIYFIALTAAYTVFNSG